MFAALLSAIFLTGEDVTNKYLLSKLKIAVKDYLPIVFVLITITTFFFLPANFFFNVKALSLVNIIILLIALAAAAAWNYLFAKSLQSESLHEFESIILLVPLVTVIFAAIFLPYERNIHVLFAGGLASLTLVIAHWKKHKIVFSQNAKRTFLAILFQAVESVCLRQLLHFYSPALLYFVRVFILSIVFLYIYKPDFRIMQVKPIRLSMIVSAALGAGLMIFKYYALASIGLVSTTIVLLIAPLMTMAASYIYFKERTNFRRDVIVSCVVIACIIYSTVAR